MVANYCRYVGRSIVWDFHFRRNLTDRKVSDFTRLLRMLEMAYLSIARYGVGLWKSEVKGQFSAKSFFKDMNVSSNSVQGWKSFWNTLVPPRVLVFCWIARRNSILTIDNLRRRNIILVNGCLMCLKDEETVHHHLIHCSFAHRVWSVILMMFDMQ